MKFSLEMCCAPFRKTFAQGPLAWLQFSKPHSCVLTLLPMLVVACFSRVACVSTPSVYQKLRELRSELLSVCLFEFDQRFAIYGEDFIFYDYNRPLDFPGDVAAHSFDIVIADPPYLSVDCLRKTAETVRYLTRGKILLCTGECWPRLRKSMAAAFKPQVSGVVQDLKASHPESPTVTFWVLYLSVPSSLGANGD